MRGINSTQLAALALCLLSFLQLLARPNALDLLVANLPAALAFSGSFLALSLSLALLLAWAGALVRRTVGAARMEPRS